MKKRKFIQVLGKGVLGTVLVPGAILDTCSGLGPETILCSLPPQKKNPKNWIWIRGAADDSRDEWKQKFELMQRSGFHAVLVQVYNGHTAMFEHPDPIVPVKIDLLEKIIPLAHAAGLELHAWMWSMPCNNPAVINKHPDWFAVNGNGEPSWSHPAYVNYYKFLCPCHPGAVEFVTSNVKALAAYDDLDGIHLDYIRLPDVILAEALQPKYDIVQDSEYPEYDYSYSEDCRQQFKAQSGIDPLSLEDPSKNKEWLKFRFDTITTLVNDHLVPAAKARDKFISAAVFPNWESVRQQWHNWNLDAFMPMLYHNFYNEDIDWIGEETQLGIDLVKNNQPVYSGLFVPNLSPAELKQAIKISKLSGGSGVSLFDFNAMTDGHWHSLRLLSSIHVDR